MSRMALRPGAMVVAPALAAAVMAVAVPGVVHAEPKIRTKNVACEASALQKALSTKGKVRLVLKKNCTYNLTERAYNKYSGTSTYFGLLAQGDKTVIGNGATLKWSGTQKAGVLVVRGNLHLENVTVTGGTYSGIAIGDLNGNKWTLEMTDVTVTGNTGSHTAGGGVWVAAGGKLQAHRSRIAGNTTQFGNGGGVAVNPGGSATLIDSQVENNSATGDPQTTANFPQGGNGGGIYNRGTLTLKNSTVTNNTSRHSALNEPKPEPSGDFSLETGHRPTSEEKEETYPDSGEGGGIYNAGTLTLDGRSRITGNTTAPFKTGGTTGKVGGLHNSGTVKSDGLATIDSNVPANCGGPQPLSPCR
ncbi:hypothetical protein ACIQVT_01005 [Streptomyces sp. NPDC100445]|uniref:hypothetical protein n=1 Tax=Streptomyces sp. NPDC100445 TaxID=3366102 RepID=UPI0037F61DD7